MVLIIGILAAIALPQYNRAVEKSRLTNAFTMIKSIREAQERYFLAKGEQANNFEDLDIEIPGVDTTVGCGETSRCRVKGEYLYRMGGDLVQVRRYSGGNLTGPSRVWVVEGVSSENNRTRLTCIADKEYVHKVCKSLGGTLRDGTTSYYDLP